MPGRLLGWRALFLYDAPLALLTFALTLLGETKDGPAPHRDVKGLVSAVAIV
ncbi:MAG: hypothetical protein WBX27_12885 [Specibacter sp.]